MNTTAVIRSLTAALAALAVTAPAARAAALPAQGGTWGGYESSAPPSTDFTGVSGTFTVPVAVCGAKSTIAAFWVGLGGDQNASFYGPIQDGIDADCNHGRAHYYGWTETFPDPAVNFKTLPVKPGDVIRATVVLVSDGALMTLTDETTGRSVAKHRRIVLHPAATQTAEWVVEGPYESPAISMTGFAPVAFTRATATLGGHTGPIDDPAWDYSAEDLDANSGANLAAASPTLTAGAFTITFGPVSWWTA